MDGNSAVILAQKSPEFGNRLRKQCDLYMALLPVHDRYTHDDDGNDVLQRDPHAPLRRCIMQWKAFAGVCSSARAVLYLRGACAPLTQSIESSLRNGYVAAAEEHEVWLAKLEVAVAQIRADRTRKRPAPDAVVAAAPEQQQQQCNGVRGQDDAADNSSARYKRHKVDDDEEDGGKVF
jgi:hypothetical protein